MNREQEEQTRPNDGIRCVNIIGQVEGHLELPSQNKTTKYEEMIPYLLSLEREEECRGVLILINTLGGDVEAGLAIAEVIAGLSKPTVSVVLGGGHSIGVAIAVAADCSFIVPSATMAIHPIRMSGVVIGVTQTFEYFDRMQERVVAFVCRHCAITEKRFRKLMLETGEIANDVGTVLFGADAVERGLIDRLGGVGDALAELRDRIQDRSRSEEKE